MSGLKTRYWKEITAAAAEHKLDPVLVEAVVVQESAGNADAFRWEKDFWNRLLKPNPVWASKNPRRVSSSYGLMQPLYVVAVERGLDPKLPPEVLFVPEMSLKYGCAHLRWMSSRIEARYPTASPDAKLLATLASYNGGFQGPDSLRPTNRAYAQSVLKHYQQLQQEHQAAPSA